MLRGPRQHTCPTLLSDAATAMLARRPHRSRSSAQGAGMGDFVGTPSSVSVGPTPPSGSTSSPRRRRAVVAGGAVAAALLLAAALVFVHWRDGLRLFGSGGAEVGAEQVAVGRTFYATAIAAPGSKPLSLRLTSASADVTANTAHADVRVLLCTLSPGPGSLFGAAWSLQPWCSAVRPFTPGSYRLSSYAPTAGAVVVVIAITPRSAGHVHVAGIRIGYEQGIRRGHELAGTAADTHTRDS